MSSTKFTSVLLFAALTAGIVFNRIKRDAGKKLKTTNSSNQGGSAKVYLVGAGPGAADLISVRGLELLKRADVVLNDRLVSPELLRQCKKDCLLLNVGKSSEKDRFSQKELEVELVRVAKEVGENKIVVRLKGGDPYIYGLGASEGLALDAAGIEWEYVPGLSSAISLPGLCLRAPLTHKGISAGFIVLSGHVAPTLESEWGQLPRCTQPLMTLVVIMCAKNLQSITQFLMLELGWGPNIPGAVIQSGSINEERTLRGTLECIAENAKKQNIDEAPLCLVIGRTLDLLTPVETSSVISRIAISDGETKKEAWGMPREDKKKKEEHEREWWVFGYGSLIWRTSEDVPHIHVEDGYIEGYVRRFWQSSPDHRGTEERPGRVVTVLPIDVARNLIQDPLMEEEKVFGRVFKIDPEKIEETRFKLEHREKAGYVEKTALVRLKDGRTITASLFIAMPENEHFAGPQPLEGIAERIHIGIGPSGTNLEYFDELLLALSAMQKRWGDGDRVVDQHILELDLLLAKIRAGKTQ